MVGKDAGNAAGRVGGSRRGRCPTGRPLARDGAAYVVRTFETADGALDLEGFLKALNDAKFEQLREGVEREARRRGGVAKTPTAAATENPRDRRRKRGNRNPPRVESSLTFGQQRLARAALAAGASPAVVAKELGIGRAQVAGLARTMKTDRPPRF